MSRLLLCLLFAGCATVEKVEKPEGLFLPADKLALCQDQGGCVVISRDQLREFVLKHRDEASKDAKGECLSNTWGELNR